MKVMNRIAFHSAMTLALCMPCRAAFALESNDSGARYERIEQEPTAPGPSEPKRDDSGSEKDKAGNRRVDHVRVGVLGSVAFPRPLAIEGMVKVERMIGVGIEYSALPQLSIDGVNTHFWALAADARLFPFHDAFFVGLRAGRQHLGGDATVTVAGVGSLNEAVSVDTTFINPRIGFLWTWDPGVTLGLNLGIQIPLSATSSSSLPPGIAVSNDVTRVTNSLGRYTLPTVDLLQIGVLL
jgi:hypothetical protein